MEPGASYVGLGFESEYVGRWGNSTGHTGADWQVASLTNDPGSGFQPGSGMFRISTPGTHPADDGNINTPPPQPPSISSTQGVPYGTIISNTLGAPNFLSGDYNKDGRVSAADYVVWRNSVGQTGSDAGDHPADGNHDYLVNTADFNVWRSHFGQPASFGVGSGATITLPEPAAWLLAALASLPALRARKRPAA
jgi:Dockerin type I domain